jgi:serralysin
VAGIYIDPLVQAGLVERFGPNDSQRRFQNDLQIENINRVLGANDYDRDGLQEVYFALTDGTAYLRAIMEADGNIRYANYQSQQEVIDYLTANGFSASTWAGWFTNSTSAAVTMQDSVDAKEANTSGSAPPPPVIDPASYGFDAPFIAITDERLLAEFYG